MNQVVHLADIIKERFEAFLVVQIQYVLFQPIAMSRGPDKFACRSLQLGCT
jgi:hypothetical protein